MSDDENPETEAPEEEVIEEETHDDHDEHTFPRLAGGFMAVFGWLVFFTIIEVMAIRRNSASPSRCLSYSL